jgi:dTDP-4-dehydrorhamnose reductase/UDP-glucose 4-epimerase
MTGRVLVVGRGMLGKALARNPGADGFRFASHEEALRADALEGVDCVVNLAVAPTYWTEEYRPEIDFDRRLAAALRGRPIHYVMASSRKVYSGGIGPFAESAPLRSTDAYGRNKAKTEAVLSEMLGERLTILRIGNVIGFDGDWKRKLFANIMLDTLRRDGRVILDVSPFTRRDFVTEEAAAGAIARIARERPPGVFNLGLGAGVEVGRIALWTIAGYGKGELVVTRPEIRDEFILDVSKITARIGPVCTTTMIEAKCTELGKALAHA